MFLRVLCVITSALTVLTTLSMTSCGADNAISSEASESAVTSTADSGKTAKDILSAIEGDHMDASTFYGEDSFTKNTEKLYGIEADKLSDGGILYSSDGNYADEISMLKMADGSSAKNQLADRLSYMFGLLEDKLISSLIRKMSFFCTAMESGSIFFLRTLTSGISFTSTAACVS